MIVGRRDDASGGGRWCCNKLETNYDAAIDTYLQKQQSLTRAAEARSRWCRRYRARCCCGRLQTTRRQQRRRATRARPHSSTSARVAAIVMLVTAADCRQLVAAIVFFYFPLTQYSNTIVVLRLKLRNFMKKVRDHTTGCLSSRAASAAT